MTTREYLGICAHGHRSYLRLAPVTDMQGRCTACGQPAELFPLPPPGGEHLKAWADRMAKVKAALDDGRERT